MSSALRHVCEPPGSKFIEGATSRPYKVTLAVYIAGVADHAALPAGSAVQSLTLRHRGTGNKITPAGAAISDLTLREATCTWAAGDTDVPGVYDATWSIDVGGGTVEKYIDVIEIVTDKAAAA